MTFRRGIVPVLLCAGIGATLLREILFARYFGTSESLEVFRVAFSLPNMLGQGLAPAFIGAVIPLLVSADRDGQRSAFVASLLRFNFLVIAALTTLGVLTSQWQARWMAPGFDPSLTNELSAQIKITWLFFLGVGGSLGLRAVLNERELFWPGASVSLISGSVLALGCVAYALSGGTDWSAGLLAKLAVLGGVLVFLVHAVAGRGELKELVFNNKSLALRALAVSIASVFVYQALNTLPRFIDRAVASGFEQGALASLDYSFNVLTVPGILLATSFVTVFYPAFAKAVADHAPKGGYIAKFVLVLLVAALVGLGFFLFTQSLVEMVYGRGAFDQNAVQRTTQFLKWHSLGLPFMVSAIILGNALLGYRRIGLLVAVGVFRVAVKLVAVAMLVPNYGIRGLAVSFVIVELATTLLLVVMVANLVRQRSEHTSD